MMNRTKNRTNDSDNNMIGLSMDSENSSNGISSSSNLNNATSSVTEILNRINYLQEELKVAQDLLSKSSDNSDTTGNEATTTPATKKKNKKKKKKSGENKNKNTHDDDLLLLGTNAISEIQQHVNHVINNNNNTNMPSVSLSTVPLVSKNKRGYLFKWLDRSIGWGGTKWGLRFVVLENGTLSYYTSHTDIMSLRPKYVLSLRGCMVQEDGWKRNKQYRNKSKTTDPPFDEPGAYFFLFSIYQRPLVDHHHDDDDMNEDDELLIVPLLRFSTPSIAERNLWVQCIHEACLYCDTDEYMIDERRREMELELQYKEQQRMNIAMPEAKNGTLPPLYFAPPSSVLRKNQHRSRPSFSKLHSSMNHIPAGLQRTASRNFDADKQLENSKSTKGYPPSKPMHRASAPSYLSLEAPVQNYRGFFNLGVIVLMVYNVRMLAGSIKNHGFLMHPSYIVRYVLVELPHKIVHHPDPWSEFPFVSGFILQLIFILTSYIIERMLSKQRISEPFGMLLHHINAHSALLIPLSIVWKYIDSPPVGSVLLIHAAITWMKIISYFLANEDYRLASYHASLSTSRRRPSIVKNDNNTNNAMVDDSINKNEPALLLGLVADLDENEINISYPQNITIRNILYFWCCPSLTYQIAFPKSKHGIRWFKIGNILMRMTITFTLFTFVAGQIVSPILSGLVNDLIQSGGSYTLHMLVEYWLRLSIANTYLWLLMFYFYFHLYLNLTSELLRFGDRIFYKDWWNSSEISTFWRLWNRKCHSSIEIIVFTCIYKYIYMCVFTKESVFMFTDYMVFYN